MRRLSSDGADILDACRCSSCSISSAAPRAERDGLPGRVAERADVAPPPGYAVFDCETTGTDVRTDEIVSLALIRLDRDGVETARFTSLVRPSRPIPAEATAVHGIADEDVACAALRRDRRRAVALLDDAVFVAHNASFDLGMLHHASPGRGSSTSPAQSHARSRRSGCWSRSQRTIGCSRSATGVGWCSPTRTTR